MWRHVFPWSRLPGLSNRLFATHAQMKLQNDVACKKLRANLFFDPQQINK
jgi:hypothetical protein